MYWSSVLVTKVLPVTNTVPSLLNLVPLSERILKTEAKIHASVIDFTFFTLNIFLDEVSLIECSFSLLICIEFEAAGVYKGKEDMAT